MMFVDYNYCLFIFSILESKYPSFLASDINEQSETPSKQID